MLRLIKTQNGMTATTTSTKRKSRQRNKGTSADRAASVDLHVVATLEKLLTKARAGELTGLMYVVRAQNQDHGVGIAGSYINDVQSGLSAFSLIYSLLGDNLRAQQQT